MSITFRCRDDKDCEAKKMAWETRYIDRVLRSKKAVCEGYSMLFKRMCDIAGLRAQVLTGYIKTKDYEVGMMGSLDHAWNSIYKCSNTSLIAAKTVFVNSTMS
jgi:transglutaminase/protease-like cytokinesis protein 3